MFKGLIVFGAGMYTGVYIAQNHNVRTEDVNDLANKMIKFLDEKMKENQKK